MIAFAHVPARIVLLPVPVPWVKAANDKESIAENDTINGGRISRPIIRNQVVKQAEIQDHVESLGICELKNIRLSKLDASRPSPLGQIGVQRHNRAVCEIDGCDVNAWGESSPC